MTQIAKVAVAAATYAIDKPYDYLVPSGMELSVGCRVTVPFGRGNRTAEGMVLQLRQEVPAKPLKAIRSLLDRESVLSEKEIRLALWMRQRYFCTFYDALHTILPAAVWYRYREIWSLCPTAGEEGLTEREQAVCRMLSDGPQERETLCTALGEDIPSVLYQMKKKGLVSVETETSRKIKDHMVELASLAAPAQEVLERLERRRRSAPRQYEAAAFLAKCGETTVHDLCYFTGATRQTLRSLEKQGLIALRSREEYRISPREYGVPAEEITLNQQQQSAYDTILRQTETGRAGVTLLQGVTGSGKTLVFLKLIERCLALGRRALVLVPEISLTPQMILRLKSRFGRRVAVQHSALNHTERLLQWQMIQDGGADIVVGTRSAVFAPLENIGLVIIDEEQEHTYRSESAPRYAAHEVARQRAAENGSLLLLASATPSTESFYAAQNGRTQLVRLTQRYGGNPLPSVQIVDMRAELASGNPREISLAMEDAIRRNLDAGKQTILLLNRRGYQTMAQCDDCREVLKCPKCSVPMVYHKAGHKLLCHYCGTQLDPPPKTCPACGGKLLYRGFGTQKAEEELAQLFPEARVLRMDQDSTAAKDAHEKLLAKFARHEYDIMVGTQMVAKGLDFEDVTLVGVLGIDSLLFAQGFRAYETVFSLITQVVGRSGRAKDPGFAIIQTTDPDNPVLNLAAAQDYDAFFEQEIAYRKLGLYPPFCGLCVVGFSGPKEIEVARAAARFSALLGRQAAQQPDLPLRVLGPTPGNIEKINENYRYKLTIKCRADKRFRDLVRQTLGLYEQEKLPSKATVVVDMHSDGDI